MSAVATNYMVQSTNQIFDYYFNASKVTDYRYKPMTDNTDKNYRIGSLLEIMLSPKRFCNF